jgi:hypothetical protein
VCAQVTSAAVGAATAANSCHNLRICSNIDACGGNLPLQTHRLPPQALAGWKRPPPLSCTYATTPKTRRPDFANRRQMLAAAALGAPLMSIHLCHCRRHPNLDAATPHTNICTPYGSLPDFVLVMRPPPSPCHCLPRPSQTLND